MSAVRRSVALVTGGSRGIGRAVATALAKDGCDLILNFLSRREAAEELAHELTTKYGTNILLSQADCGQYDQTERMITQALTEFSQIDILVNNAGKTQDKLTARMSSEDFLSSIQTNLLGPFHCSKLVYTKSMMKRQTGRIINLSSTVALTGNPGQANYSAAKGGVLSLTKTLAKEFARSKVTVNSVCPGFIETEMTSLLSEDVRKEISQNIPLKRFGTPEEVAGMVRYLALDPSAAYVTGHTFCIDGGLAIGSC